VSRLSTIHERVLSNTHRVDDDGVKVNLTYQFFASANQGSGYYYLREFGLDEVLNSTIRARLVRLLLDKELACLD